MRIESLAGEACDVTIVRLLGFDGELEFSCDEDGLMVLLGDAPADDRPFCLKII